MKSGQMARRLGLPILGAFIGLLVGIIAAVGVGGLLVGGGPGGGLIPLGLILVVTPLGGITGLVIGLRKSSKPNE